ncbi:MAG: hypothetical protein Q9216_001620 [Gyalolechia sp. 2 TL-2023]
MTVNSDNLPWQQPSHPGLVRVHHIPSQFASYTTSLVSLPAGTVFPLPITNHFFTKQRTWSSVEAANGMHIDLNSDLFYVNHSCAPSLEYDVNKMEVRSSRDRDLHRGDLLTFFYPSTEWHMVQPFDCTCNERGCLGLIMGACELGKDALKGYWLNTFRNEKIWDYLTINSAPVRYEQLEKDNEPWSQITPSKELDYHDCFDGFRCVRLDVPMDWNHTNLNDGPRVQLAVVRLPAKVPVTDPRYGGLLWLQSGGPGESGWRQREVAEVFSRDRRHQAVPAARDETVIVQRAQWKRSEEKVLFWGFSYGTVIGAYFAVMQPYRVQRMVLDGVVDTPDYMIGTRLQSLRDADSIVDRPAENCDLAGPSRCPLYDDGGAWKIAVKIRSIILTLKEYQLSVPGGSDGRLGPVAPDIITYSEVMGATFSALYAPIQSFPSLLSDLAEIARSNTTALAAR